MLAYLVLLGGVVFIGMLSVLCGVIAGWISRSAWVAALTSCLLYSALLLAACCLLYQTVPQDAVVHAQSVNSILTGGGFCLVVGVPICALVPAGLYLLIRRPTGG